MRLLGTSGHRAKLKHRAGCAMEARSGLIAKAHIV
jgi:hypothetical protein